MVSRNGKQDSMTAQGKRNRGLSLSRNRTGRDCCNCLFSLITHSAEVRVLELQPSKGAQSLTVRVPHLFFSFLHIGKVIHNRL